MRPNPRKSQPDATADRTTYRLPQAAWPKVPPHTRVGRGSQPPRPIERPPSLRVIRDAPLVAPPPSTPRREKRVLLFIVYAIIVLVATSLVLEGIFLALGKSLL